MEYGLIGEHLSHSFSPIIHSKISDYSYELKELAPPELKDFLQKREFKGINVTIPYKQAVMEHLDAIDDSAQKIGAVAQNRVLGTNLLTNLIQHCGQRVGRLDGEAHAVESEWRGF